MALIIPPGFALASWEFSGPVGTQPFATTCGISYEDSGSGEVTIANALFRGYAGQILPVTSTSLTLDRVTLRVPGVGGTTGTFQSTEDPEDGEDGAAHGPMAMSAVVRKITATVGRPGRGRMFIPGTAAESEIGEDGTLSPTQRANITTRINAMWDDVADDEPEVFPVLLHDEESPITVPSPINNFITAPLVGWIRKRIR